MKADTKKLVLTAMFASLCCVATMMIKIPSPLKGYINLGDCVVLLAGWLLPSAYGCMAAGIGSAMADIFSGYVMYAPATFAIKALMAYVAYTCFNKINRNGKDVGARVISATLAEIVMVVGYLAFESCLYGFVPSLVNVVPNMVQGVAGILISIQLIRMFKNTNIF